VIVVRLLIQQIIFLATASDEEVHPDVAVAQLEAITYGVRSLDAGEREAFDREVQAMVAEAEPGSSAADALAELSEMLE
jgi:hypothetical protein